MHIQKKKKKNSKLKKIVKLIPSKNGDNRQKKTITEDSSMTSATSLTSGIDVIAHLMYMSTYTNGNYISDEIMSLNQKSKKS